MPGFKIVKGYDSIPSSNRWTKVYSFKSMNREVDDKGRKVESTYQGKHYKIISKEERKLGTIEKFCRNLIGILAVILSVGLARKLKTINNLISKDKVAVRYAIPLLTELKQNPVPAASSSKTASQKKSEQTKKIAESSQKKLPKPPHPQLGEFLTNKEKEKFQAKVQALSAESILTCAQKDSFGFSEGRKGFLAHDDTEKRLKTIFESLAADDKKLQAFLKGVILNDNENEAVNICWEVLNYIDSEKDVPLKELHYRFMFEAIDQGNLSEWFKKLCDHAKRAGLERYLTAFIRFIIHSSLKTEAFAQRLLQLKTGFERNSCNFLTTALRNFNSVVSLNLSEKAKLQTWCEENYIPCEKMAEELRQFDKIRADKKAVSALLDGLFKKDRWALADSDKSRTISSIFKEMSLEEIVEYINASDQFKNPTDSEFTNCFKAAFIALPEQMQEKFVEQTLTAFPEKAKRIQRDLFAIFSLSADYEKINKLSQLVNQALNQAEAKKFVDDFKEARTKKKEASDLLAKVLHGNQGDAFKLIAEEMTEDEVRIYVSQKNDFFLLDQLGEALPQGIFRDFSVPKLRIFIESAFQWPHDKLEKFFPKFVCAASILEKDKKREICEFIAQWLLKDPLRQYLLLPKLAPVKEEFIAFFGYYLSAISMLNEPVKNESLNAAYRTNETLFKACLGKGLQDKGCSPERVEFLKQWFASKLKDMPMQLSLLSSREEIKQVLDGCRTNPDKVRAFLKDSKASEQQNLQMVIEEMTVEEIALYASMENNCFGINPDSYKSLLVDSLPQTIFKATADAEKLAALMRTTLERKDCQGRLNLFILFIAFSYAAKEAIRGILFDSMLAFLKDNNQFKEFKANCHRYHEQETKFALKHLENHCLRNGYKKEDLGMLPYI